MCSPPFSSDERQQLVAMLNPGGLDYLPPTIEPIVTTVLHEAALERIFEWWTDERDEHLPKYEKNFWPESVPRRFEDPAGGDRRSWMTLFALGLMQRLGRTRDFQNRGFIDFTGFEGMVACFLQRSPSGRSRCLDEHPEGLCRATECRREVHPMDGLFPEPLSDCALDGSLFACLSQPGSANASRAGGISGPERGSGSGWFRYPCAIAAE
jgi:hypothetical protein